MDYTIAVLVHRSFHFRGSIRLGSGGRFRQIRTYQVKRRLDIHGVPCFQMRGGQVFILEGNDQNLTGGMWQGLCPLSPYPFTLPLFRGLLIIWFSTIDISSDAATYKNSRPFFQPGFGFWIVTFHMCLLGRRSKLGFSTCFSSS